MDGNESVTDGSEVECSFGSTLVVHLRFIGPTLTFGRVLFIRPADALEVLSLLIDAGVDVWVDGRVDVLVGRQTHEHDDLDLSVARTDLVTALELLVSVGYVVPDDRYKRITVRLRITTAAEPTCI